MPIVLSHKRMFITSLVMSFLALVLQVQIPKLLEEAIDNSLIARTVPLSHYVKIVFILAVIAGIAGYISRYFLMRTAYEMEFDLRNIIYSHLTKMSFPFYDRVQSGQLISRANSDIRSVQMYLTFAPSILVQCSVAVVAFGYMLSINVPLALVAMIPMPFVYLLGLQMRKSIFPVSWLIQSRLADVATIVDENINGVRVVKSFAAEQRELTTLAKAADRLQWSYIKDAYIRAKFTPTVQNLPQIGLALVVLFGGWLVVHGSLKVGAIVAFSLYIVMLQAPFQMLGMIIMMGQRASASSQRIYEILDEEPTVVDRPGAVDLVDCKGDVRFESVQFSYSPRQPADPRRTSTCTSGPARPSPWWGARGSGKSTVARLLTRFYDVTGGKVVDRRPRRARPDAGQPAGQPSASCSTSRSSSRPRSARTSPTACRAPTSRTSRRPPRRPAPTASSASSPQGYDTVVGERGLHAVGGPAPADRHRQNAAGQPADPRARRRHQRHRRAGGAHHPRVAPQADGGPDHPDHRPPPVDDQPGRPGAAHGRRTDRGRRDPRRADGDRAALRRRAGPGRAGVGAPGRRGEGGRGPTEPRRPGHAGLGARTPGADGIDAGGLV